MKITVAGEELHLLPERALFWPKEKALIVADLHLGKADVFRARGIPIPTGSSGKTLTRLTHAISQNKATQLIVLGDFFHAKESLNETVLQALQTWRSAQAHIKITIVEGNHDKHAGTAKLAQMMDVGIVEEPFTIGPFAFAHHPPEACATDAYTLYGHIHPCTVLRSSVDRLRVPCFVFGPRAGVLPAFGAFTGGHVVSPGAQETVYAIAESKILKIPAAQKR